MKPQIRTYLVKVWRVDGTGTKKSLGAAEIYTTSKTKAREEAFQELWDPDYPENQYFPEMEVTDITDQNRNGK